MSDLPKCETLDLKVTAGRLDLTFNRPAKRNAINIQMAGEFARVVEWLAHNNEIRVVVLRGAGGHFCAGADIKERLGMAEQKVENGEDPIAEENRQAGLAFIAFGRLPQTTIAAVEGSAFGGGMGYACATDITIVTKGARMGMPETGLGVAPAQIAPIVVGRIGLARARQLALTGERFGGEKAYEYGIAQYLCEDDGLEKILEEVVAKVLQCAPKASAVTKQIMARVGSLNDEDMAAYAAKKFAALNRGEEGREGQAAFAQKRRPHWQVKDGK